jgi:methionyl-tRNA formyltransferase
MKIAVVTQEDSFYIPKLLSLVMAGRGRDIVAVSILPGEMVKTVSNVRKYLAFMGPLDFTRYGIRYSIYHALNLLFPKGIGDRFYSVKAVARRHGVPILEPGKVNAAAHLEALRQLGVELIVSIAAPQIFKEELLALPKHGCINIHNALLPRYQGVMPSFWVLANGESTTGTTVHYMNERIDAGALILQRVTRIEDDDTLHSLIYRTKITMGPAMLLEAIDLIEGGQIPSIDVDWSQATYYSFPDREAVTRFRARNRKFR